MGTYGIIRNAPGGVPVLDENGRIPGNMMPDSFQIQHRRGTASELQGTVLAQGEIGVATDQKYIAIGDGSTPGGQPIGPWGRAYKTYTPLADAFEIEHDNFPTVIMSTSAIDQAIDWSGKIAPGTYTNQILTLIINVRPVSVEDSATISLKIAGDGEGDYTVGSAGAIRSYNIFVETDGYPEAEANGDTHYTLWLWNGFFWTLIYSRYGVNIWEEITGVNNYSFGKFNNISADDCVAIGSNSSLHGDGAVTIGKGIVLADGGIASRGGNVQAAALKGFAHGETTKIRYPGQYAFGPSIANTNVMHSFYWTTASTSNTTPIKAAWGAANGLEVVPAGLWKFTATVGAWGASVGAVYVFEGVVRRNVFNNASSLVAIGTIDKTFEKEEASMSGCNVTCAVNTTDKTIELTLTGLGTAVQWFIEFEITELNPVSGYW